MVTLKCLIVENNGNEVVVTYMDNTTNSEVKIKGIMKAIVDDKMGCYNNMEYVK